MKATRHTATALFIVIVLAIFVLSYGTRAGRRAAREAMRVARLAGNATRIYPQPLFSLRIWRGSRITAFRIDVYESGRMVVSGQGRAERQLPRDTARQLVESAWTAFGDFSSEGCETVSDGLNADLYLLREGRWTGTVCRNASTWPRGPDTRRLLDEISRELPGNVKLPLGP